MSELPVRGRKRDRLRSRLGFGRDVSPDCRPNPGAATANPPPVHASAPPSSSPGPHATAGPPPTPPPRDLWFDALKLLSETEQLAIQKIQHTCLSHGALPIEEIISITKAKQEECERKSYTFHFRGKEIILRDVAAKIVLWLDKFKSIGDVAVNFDPVHASLPWAGVRFLLEVLATLFLQRILLTYMKGSRRGARADGGLAYKRRKNGLSHQPLQNI